MSEALRSASRRASGARRVRDRMVVGISATQRLMAIRQVAHERGCILPEELEGYRSGMGSWLVPSVLREEPALPSCRSAEREGDDEGL